MSIMTHISAQFPPRALQGSTDSACYFYDTTRSKFEERLSKLFPWIDVGTARRKEITTSEMASCGSRIL